MKAQYFNLSTPLAQKNCLAMIQGADLDGKIEVVIRDAKTSKTIAQLGGLFGVWISYLSDVLGKSEKTLHTELKNSFLARIYVTEPKSEEQEQWVELLGHYQEIGDMEKLERHAERISLSWATIDQMKAYMNAIENHFMDQGIPLPILDKFRRYYR